ncbi:hypothetical protein R5W23_002036 [Gemmata sp. JC673]|uniref:DUF945 family protein n=1 Tax=Gemmata algarum TaxID=2975278 RepID=A0ABU5F231_9BACT|nr:hypothetical protein [Gemmata algarum]MDY3560790.1 hypothetical protein [Gemmata algarum]
MPPRIAVAGIVAFWIATTGYVAYRDVWPRLFASGPPPVAIELADEAKQNVPAKWTLYRNGQPIGKLTTLMKYHDATDEFQFTYRYSKLRLEQGGVALEVPDATSDVRMTRAGDFKEQALSGKLEVVAGKSRFGGQIDVRGTVSGGTLTGHGSVKSSFGDFEADLEPVPVRQGQPLNPLQPVNRIAGIHGGMRSWVVHEYNPLQDALADLIRKQLAKSGLPLGAAKPKEPLLAEVAGEPRVLSWQNQDIPCWVIEYRRKEDAIARTWVQVRDGKVLRQEAFEGGEALRFERED